MRQSSFRCLSEFNKKDVNVKGYVRKRKGRTILVNPFKRKQELSDKQKTIRNVGIGIGATALLGTGVLGGIAFKNRKGLLTAMRVNSNIPIIQKIKNADMTLVKRVWGLVKNPNLKKNYQKNMTRVLDEAKDLAKKIPEPKIDYNKESVTFVLPGYSGKGENTIREARGLKGAVLGITRNKNTIPVGMDEFNIDPPLDLNKHLANINGELDAFKKANSHLPKNELDKKLRDLALEADKRSATALGVDGTKTVKDITNLIEKTFVKDSYNPETKNVLAQILKIREKNPNMKVNILGFSGGGFVTQDVAQHLDSLGIPYKAITMGTPDIGVMNLNKKNVIGIIGEKDHLFNKTPIFNKKTVRGGRDHNAMDYLSDSEVKKHIKNHFYS